MDSLTQIVLGAAVGEAVLGKKVGNKAILWGAIAGTIPDLDTLVGNFLDPITAIEIHRGISHSILFSIGMAPLLGWLISKLYYKTKEATWQQWSWLFFWGLVTHPLLDAHTTWGTQLFWPFDLRLAYQNIFVIDPLYTLPFLLCVILAMRLPRTSEKRKRVNTLGLILSSSYLVITLLLKGVTYFKFTTALDNQNINYTKIDTRPAPFNSLLWSANIDAANHYVLADYSIFDTQAISFIKVPKQHQLLDKVEDKKALSRLITISEGWYAVSKKGEQLYFNDLRFGAYDIYADTLNFAFSYKLVETKNGLTIEEPQRNSEEMKTVLGNLWNRIWGN